MFDSKKFTKVLNEIRELGFECRGLEPKKMNSIVGIVIVDREGLDILKKYVSRLDSATLVRIEEQGDCTSIVAIVLSQGVEPKCRELVIGIDMGKSIGVAIVCDHVCIFAKSFRGFGKAFEFIDKVFRCIATNRKIVRIGIPRKEDPEYEAFIEKLVKILGNDVELELIPEKGSSSYSLYLRMGRKIDEDALAAINIALVRSA